jgi:hypothetical protein
MGKEVTTDMLEGKEDNLTNQDTQDDPHKETVDSTLDKTGAEDGHTLDTTDKTDKTDEKPLKYSSHEEAEKAYREAEKKLHESTTEAAKLKKVVDDLTKKIDAANEKTADTGPKKSTWEVKREKVLKDTMTAANAIPADDPEYNTKVAQIWIDAQMQVSKIALEEQRAAEEDLQLVQKSVSKALKDVEIDGVPGVEDLFWAQAKKADRNLSLADQIKWAAGEVKALIDGIRGKERTRMKEEKDTRDNLNVLGRGNRITTKPEPEGSKTIGDARKAVLEKRKLRSTG